MTVYFGNMNMPIFGQAHHSASCLSDTAEYCIFCNQHVDSSICRNVRTWSERMYRVNLKRLCTICLGSHYSRGLCRDGLKPCQYCGASRKHHESLCPENPALKENDKSAPEQENPIDNELQATMKMLTDKGMCHKCLGRHRTEACRTLHWCQTCRSPYHHRLICPEEVSVQSNKATEVLSPTVEDARPISPVPLPLDLTGHGSEKNADLSTPIKSSSPPTDNGITSSRCSTPSSEASDGSSPVPSEFCGKEAHSPSCDDDIDNEVDASQVSTLQATSALPSETPASCPTSHPTKPANGCSKKTHLEMLFSGCRIDEDVIRPEPHTDAPPAKSHDNVKCWLQNLRENSPESTALPEAEKALSSDGYTKEYYNKMYSEVLRYHEHLKAEMGPEKYWYYYCYSYYYYYYPELLNQWLNAITPVAGGDATQTDASPQPIPEASDNESRNRCSSASSGASDDSFVMWKSPDSPVPSECRWDEASASSFDDDFDNDMDASTQPTPQPTASSDTTDSSLSSDPTKPSNTKKTTLEMLFSACSMNEDVVRLESHADAPPAKSYDNVNCWLQNLRRGSAESASSPEVVALTQLTPQSTTPYVSNYPQWCINAVLRHYNSIEDYIINS